MKSVGTEEKLYQLFSAPSSTSLRHMGMFFLFMPVGVHVLTQVFLRRYFAPGTRSIHSCTWSRLVIVDLHSLVGMAERLNTAAWNFSALGGLDLGLWEFLRSSALQTNSTLLGIFFEVVL